MMNVVVKAFFVEHVAVGVGGRRGGLYARRVPNQLLIHQNDRTPFVLVELGDTKAGRKMPSGHWVVLHGTFNQNQCVVYHVTAWKHSTA